MKRNYVLVDLENVTPDNLELLVEEHFVVKIFVGPMQTKIPTEIVLTMQSLGNSGEFIQMQGTGKNALDFLIASYLGALIESEPDSYFHIISKDKGFDPLISHYRAQRKFVHRHVDVSEISILKVKLPPVLPPSQNYIKAFNSLLSRGRSRPRKPETLRSCIRVLFNPKLSTTEIDQIIEQLKRNKVVKISNNVVSYNFNGSAPLAVSSAS